MKKLTPWRRQWLRRRQLRALRQRKQARLKVPVFLTPQGSVAMKAARDEAFPAVLSFESAPKQTLEVLHNIRVNLMAGVRRRKEGSAGREFLAKGRKSIFSRYRPFESVRSISPAAALLLAAEYERFHKLTNTQQTLVNVHKWKPQVVSTLGAIGFFDLVGFPSPASSGNGANSDTIILRMRSGDTADPVAVNAVVNDLKELYPHQAGRRR